MTVDVETYVRDVVGKNNAYIDAVTLNVLAKKDSRIDKWSKRIIRDMTKIVNKKAILGYNKASGYYYNWNFYAVKKAADYFESLGFNADPGDGILDLRW